MGSLRKIVGIVWNIVVIFSLFIGLLVIIVVGIYWDDLESFSATPIVIGIGIAFVFLMLVAILIIQLGFQKHKKQAYSSRKLQIVIKLSPIVLLITSFFIFAYYYPTWYYEIDSRPHFGPYIAFHAQGGIQVSWDSRTPTTSKVEYGISAEDLTSEAYGGEYYWQTDPLAKSQHHCVLLSPLEPNRVYYYRIPGFDNKIYSFHTPPESNIIEKVMFTILGDTQGNINIQRQNIAQMKVKTNSAVELDFTIIAGDLSNRDDDITEWAMLMQPDSYGGMCTNIPWMACSGNHETSSDNDNHLPRENFKHFFQNAYAGNWEKEPNAWDVGTYYSFNYSNVHIVILDTFEYRQYNLSTAQLTWLEEDLIRANTANMWTFLVFHPSMYSTSEHGSYPNLANQIEPLMKSQKIDAIFWGHDHIFESFWAFSNESYGGTYCFTVSGGGGSLKPVMDAEEMGDRVWNGTKNEYGNYINIVKGSADNRFSSQRGYEWQLYAERVHHFMLVELDNQTATLTAYRSSDGSQIKSYTLQNH